MENIRSYKFRIYPTAAQEAVFIQFAGCRRFIWNWALARKHTVYKETGGRISLNALCAELTLLKKQPETAFLSACSYSGSDAFLLGVSRRGCGPERQGRVERPGGHKSHPGRRRVAAPSAHGRRYRRRVGRRVRGLLGGHLP